MKKQMKSNAYMFVVFFMFSCIGNNDRYIDLNGKWKWLNDKGEENEQEIEFSGKMCYFHHRTELRTDTTYFEIEIVCYDDYEMLSYNFDSISMNSKINLYVDAELDTLVACWWVYETKSIDTLIIENKMWDSFTSKLVRN